MTIILLEIFLKRLFQIRDQAPGSIPGDLHLCLMPDGRLTIQLDNPNNRWTITGKHFQQQAEALGIQEVITCPSSLFVRD